MRVDDNVQARHLCSRRAFLVKSLATGVLALSGGALTYWYNRSHMRAQAFIARTSSYQADLASIISDGLRELGVAECEIKDKRILLKPNLVETTIGAPHINTHPLVVRGAVEAFLRLGAKTVLVGEGPGHRRDALHVLEESGLSEVLLEDHIPFIDLNHIAGYSVPNAGRRSRLKSLTFPGILREVDWIVSMAKMKTHHWAGVTLSMKNLFGVMPGLYYGWPKNILHHADINKSVLDINATLRPHFAIVDGIVGMEGDGPIMGTPVNAGVLVMGRNLPAVDATCARIMGIDPHKVRYLSGASDWLGPIHEVSIEQLGEQVGSVRTNFELLETIPAHRSLRLTS